MFDRPTLYFRRKDNGAAVFRVTETQHSRLELQQIAMLKQNGEIKSQNKQEVTDAERTEIEAWHETRQAGQAAQDFARIDTLIGEMNAAAQWLQSNANDEQVTATAEPLLMAMHDLRTTLVKAMSGTGN